MKKIRNKTFETNSSSTHSITISRYKKPKEVNIPRNSKDIYMVCEFGDCAGDDCTYDCDIHTTEIDKLSFLVNMIASVYEYDNQFDDYDWQRATIEYKSKWFNKLINTDLFVWLKEVVLEETGTTIDYVMPDNDFFPFYDSVYSETSNIDEMLCLEKDEISNCYNKERFKNRIREIIFDKEIQIENKNVPYGME